MEHQQFYHEYINNLVPAYQPHLNMSTPDQTTQAQVHEQDQDSVGNEEGITQEQHLPADEEQDKQYNNPESAAKSKAPQQPSPVHAAEDESRCQFDVAQLHTQPGYATERPSYQTPKGLKIKVEETAEHSLSFGNALNRSVKTPKGSCTSRLNKTHSFGMLQRLEGYEKRKEKGMEDIKAIEEERKYNGMKAKPDIDPHSAKLAKQMSYKPIHQRFEQILETRKRREQEALENKKAKEEQQYEQFLDELHKSMRLKPEQCRDRDAYFNDMMNWKNKVEKERQQKKKLQEKSEVEGATFKPKINQKSLRMLKNHIRVPIYQREPTKQSFKQSKHFMNKTTVLKKQ